MFDATIGHGPCVALVTGNQAAVYLWNLVAYWGSAVTLVVMVPALHEGLKAAAPGGALVAAAFRLIWAALIIGSGSLMLRVVGVIAKLYAHDPAQPAATWTVLEAVENGIVSGNEVVGSLWVLVLSLTAWRNGQLGRALNGFGIIISLAGLLTIYPPLAEPLTMLFGVGMIVWSAGAGVALLRAPRPDSPPCHGRGRHRMRAVTYTRFGPPEVLQLVQAPKPAPKAREVLIRIHAATVCKEDPDMRAAPGFNGLLKPRHPILGQEFAGEVEAVGNGASRFGPGDQVFGIDAFGAYAEYKCMSERGALSLMPAGLTYVEAASLPNGALTALPFLRDHGQIRRGQTVLVYGASGSVGTAAVQLACAYGAEVTGVCSTPNLELVRSLGASRVVDYTREDFTCLGHTYDIIFDAVGKLSLSRCRDRLAKDGVYLTVMPRPEVLLYGLWASGAGGRRARFAATGLRPASRKAEDLCFIQGLIEASQFRAVIDRCYPLAQVAEAHRYVQAGHKTGNVVITLD